MKINTKNHFTEDIVEETLKDFHSRQALKKPFELQWILNMNFLNGNQYCDVLHNQLVEIEKNYYWQSNAVFNHIAPIIETRLAKLQRVRPKLTVRPFSNSQDSINASRASESVLCSMFEKLNMDKLIGDANSWSETTGTAFYKISWDNSKGRFLGEKDKQHIYEGEPTISVCSPFEIFPDSPSNENLEDCDSIIHARAMLITDIYSQFNVVIPSQELQTFSQDNNNSISFSNQSLQNTHALVIEKFQKPSADYPQGRHIIIAGNTLLCYSTLPYINGDNQTRVFPFVKQDAVKVAGCFWGKSIIERLIPLQRTYNAVKNRKYEYLNRLSIGVLAVEDGSLDTNSLTEEGIEPGKILVYRQGTQAPFYISNASLPEQFFEEEERLREEFVTISGVSDVMRSGTLPKVSSGTAVSLMIEQDDNRMASTAESARTAIVCVAKQLLRIIKQFSVLPRTYRINYNQSLSSISLAGKDIESDDVIFETENELNSSLAQRRELVMRMYSLGMFNNISGEVEQTVKNKLLDIMGFGGLFPH